MLLWCRVNANGFVMLRTWHSFSSFYFFIFFLFREREKNHFPPCTVTQEKKKKKLVVESTRICGFSPVCTTCCACCMPCFLSVLMGVWTVTVTSLSTVLVSVCCKEKWDIELLSRRQCGCGLTVKRCSWSVCGTVAVSLPLCSDC